MATSNTGGASPPHTPVHRADPRLVGAYVQTELGRATIRRELVEGAQVRAGQQALLIYDRQSLDGTDAVVEVVAETLRDLGAHLTLMQVDELIPVAAGAVAGSFAHVAKHRVPPVVLAAMRAADVVFDYTASSRGAAKYTLEIHTLATEHGARIMGGRAIEAPEALGTDPSNPVAHPEALTFPSDLLRLIARQVNEVFYTAAEAGQEFRLTNPWGTDLRITTLPGDVCQPNAAIRRHPRDDVFRGDDTNALYRAVQGFGVVQRCEGVWVTQFCTLVGGMLSAPLAVTLDGGFLVDARGGPEAARLLDLVADEPSGVHAILMGLNPKAAPFRHGAYVWNNNGAGCGVAHLALGGPGLFYRNGAWGPVGNKHYQLGNIPQISLWAGDQCVVQDGRLLTLADPAIREAARAYGDPDVLLHQFEWIDVLPS